LKLIAGKAVFCYALSMDDNLAKEAAKFIRKSKSESVALFLSKYAEMTAHLTMPHFRWAIVPCRWLLNVLF